MKIYEVDNTAVRSSRPASGYVYVTLSGSGGDNLNNLLYGRAPAMNISIKDGVDCSFSKSLGGDLLVSTFGYKPVSISITGLDLYHAVAECDATASSAPRIHEYWRRNNVYMNPYARVTVSIAGGMNSSVYQCVLTSLTAVANSDGSTSTGYGNYELSLVGIPFDWGGRA